MRDGQEGRTYKQGQKNLNLVNTKSSERVERLGNSTDRVTRIKATQQSLQKEGMSILINKSLTDFIP